MLCQISFFFFVKSLLYANFAVMNQVSCLKTYLFVLFNIGRN